jgi:hypothetical protein
MKWFQISWYRYLIDFSYFGCPNYTFREKIRIVICRARNHPAGPVWYTNAFEPDMHCKHCGDEI